MNDRYLFKAKRIDNGEWVQGALFDGKNHCIIGQEIKFSPYVSNECKIIGYEVDRNTLCQCTGWKDKTKQIIFEKDIVVCDGCVGIVEFGYYEWSTSENIGFYIDWEEVYFRKDLAYWLDKIKVVGSIIDNPKLLEVE